MRLFNGDIWCLAEIWDGTESWLSEREGGRERPGSNRWPEHQLDLNQSQYGPEITLYFTLIPANSFFQCIKCIYNSNLSYNMYKYNSILYIAVICSNSDRLCVWYLMRLWWNCKRLYWILTLHRICTTKHKLGWLLFLPSFLRKREQDCDQHYNNNITTTARTRPPGEQAGILRKYSNLWAGDGGSGGWGGV